MGAVGRFLRLGLVPALVRDFRPFAALVALVGQGNEAVALEFVERAPDPLGLLVVDRARQRPGDPQDLPVGGWR